MPEEIEVPLEEVQDRVAELHRERHGEGAPPEEAAEGRHAWTRFVAVSTALLAVVAAIGALQSGLLVNEALLQKNEQVSRLTEASDQWNYYQAEGLKSLIYKTAAQALPPGSPVAKDDIDQSKKYKDKQKDLKGKAEELVKESKKSSEAAGRYLERHHVFAISVSLCQIAIALSAVAALTRQRYIWILGMAAGGVGAALLLYGFLR